MTIGLMLVIDTGVAEPAEYGHVSGRRGPTPCGEAVAGTVAWYREGQGSAPPTVGEKE